MSAMMLDRRPEWSVPIALSFDRNDQTDRSWAGNVGTLVGNAAVASRVLTLDGTGDYATYPDSTNLDMPSAFTMSCWFEPSTPGAVSRFLMAKYNSTGNLRSYYLGAAYATNLWNVIISATGAVGSPTNMIDYRFSTTIPTSGWHHICAVVDTNAAASQRILLWQDGVTVAVTTVLFDHSGFTPFNNALNLEVGALAGTNSWKGNMDDVRIYRRALTQSEVVAIYSEGRH